jgi:hypothetical protein
MTLSASWTWSTASAGPYWDLMCQSDPESGDQADRLQFLSNWRNIRNAVMVNRQFEFDSYGAADEWHAHIGYIFRHGSAHNRR